ncbi:molybdopterin-dependent oxidoreductase [Halopiger xanaduensis]|uniref:Oxidoreductase molybdopterin binding protein n=1 Tax=Halopiger xanaduensis (strain DSM 18323 / JCM 14033 / SH-6) TaxID=797210 RepID=F8D323_HALXS|nr:molybdopterin-dependent oxidoreductase [Halopiger xanaduensis]AEH37307.1 oxidoreductase molybdopterin binding protein [Halopiger xanaduensis SH-6]
MADGDLRVPSLSSSIRLVGEETTTVDGDSLASLPLQERECEIVCATGDRYTETWYGVPVLELLERASVPPETTHLLVVSGDGYRACVAVETALEGLLALGKNGRPLADASDYETRFVAVGADGPRTVKDVGRIEAMTLEPGEDPEAYELGVESAPESESEPVSTPTAEAPSPDDAA